ncbi:MAG: radical SAM protein [Lachnospiraceae bacterium]|nr:radical SAM protein [Lachnospiraceae bacterium]
MSGRAWERVRPADSEMTGEMTGTDLGKLTEDWKGIESIVPHGAGIVGRICRALFKKADLEIPFVIDRDENKHGTAWMGAPVIPFEQAKAQIGGRKIVVMAGHDAYGKISSFLDGQGLVEFKDYCNVGQFMSEWFWDAKRMNCVFHVDMTITTRCTLRCRHCNLFIPYHKENADFAFDDLKESIDLFFDRIDFVAYFGLIGGETFLHPELGKYITYLGENYGDKIGRITVVTNGTVRPSETLLKAIKKYDMYLSISDYTDVVPYKDKMDFLIDMVKEYDIDYARNDHIVWTDFGFPERPYERTPEELEYHLASCRPNWNALHGGRFYYCNVSWCAQQSGRYKLQPQDYIDLGEVDPADREACREIVRLSRGTSSFCKICGGCGKDNTDYVKTAEQIA